jgi:hypothetical protein
MTQQSSEDAPSVPADVGGDVAPTPVIAGALTSQCLFCRSPLPADGETDEHLIPASMGGRVTNRLICTRCNSTLGTDVDSVADLPILIQLRAEVGLNPARRIPINYRVQGLEFDLKGTMTGKGTIERTQPVYRAEGGQTFIWGDTADEVRELAAQIATRAAKRGESLRLGGEPENVPGGAALVCVGGDAEDFRERFGRFAGR